MRHRWRSVKKYSSSSRKPLSIQELRTFRSLVSRLKKQGIIKGVDARSARPYFVRGGKTLAEIVNKYAGKLPPPRPPSDLKRIGQPLSFRDIGLKSKSLAGALNELDKNYQAFEKLKKPGEHWAVQIDGIRSYMTYSDLGLFAQEMKESGGIQQVLRKRADSQEIFSSLRLVRWNKSADEWKPGPQKRKRKASHAKRQVAHRRSKK